MNGFLAQLVNRHSGVTPGALVRPRPRGRFERDGNGLGEETTDAGPPAGAVAEGAGEPAQGRSDHNRHLRELDARIAAVAAQVGRPSRAGAVFMPRPDAPPARREHRRERVKDQAHTETAASDVTQGAAGSDNAPAPAHSHTRGVLEFPSPAPRVTHFDSQTQSGAATTELADQPSVPYTQAAAEKRDRQDTDDNRDAPAIPGPYEGQLALPAWLFDLKNDLRRRWPGPETRPEPVVNVTIGRVEVRAVRDDPSKPQKPERKAAAVPSLDDYLKQREKRGPA